MPVMFILVAAVKKEEKTVLLIIKKWSCECMGELVGSISHLFISLFLISVLFFFLKETHLFLSEGLKRFYSTTQQFFKYHFLS